MITIIIIIIIIIIITIIVILSKITALTFWKSFIFFFLVGSSLARSLRNLASLTFNKL